MSICMLGAGSLGSTMGGSLSAGGSPVYRVDPWREHVEAVNTGGLENWFELPDALAVELIQARNNAVARALAIDPQA